MNRRTIGFWVVVNLALGACAHGPTSPHVMPPAMALPHGGVCVDPVPGPNIRVSNAIGESNFPVVASTEEGFVVAWWDLLGQFPSIEVIPLDFEGAATGSELMMPRTGACRDPSLAVDGRGIRVGWMEQGEMVAGVPGAASASLWRSGPGMKGGVVGPYGAVLWVEKGALKFRCDGMVQPPDRKGRLAEPAPLIVANGGIEDPQLVWTGDFFAAVWSESVAGGRRIVLQRVTNDGALLGPRVIVSKVAGAARKPQMVWTGHQLAIAFTHEARAAENPNNRFRIFFALIDKQGRQPLMTRQLRFGGSADQVALATSGEEFALAFVGTRPEGGSAVFFQRLDAKGGAVGASIRVTDDEPVAVGPPAIAWGEGGYGVVWHDSRFYEGAEIFFSKVSCGASVSPEPPQTPPEDSKKSPTDGLKSVF